MTDDLDVSVCCVVNDKSEAAKSEEVCKSVELDSDTCNLGSERLKELDAYLTALEDIIKQPENGVSEIYCALVFISTSLLRSG